MRRWRLWASLVLVGIIGALVIWSGTIRARREKLRQPLIDAVMRGNEAQTTALLDQGADPNTRVQIGWRPPLWRLLTDRLTALRSGGRPRAYYNFDWPVIQVPVNRDQADIVGALLRHGANPNSRGHSGETPLMIAAAQGNTNVVHLLLHYRADVDVHDKAGDTALALATVKRHPDVTTLLRQAGATR